MRHPLLQIIRLWRARWPRLGLGALVSLAALACAVALLGLSGSLIARAVLALPLGVAVGLRLLGPARVVLRYLERLLTHDAMFRALADLRVWFFRGLARRSAGGLGFTRAGEVLARLVGDVEVLDGLYLRILVPLAGMVVILPALFLFTRPAGHALAVLLAALFAMAAFLVPWLMARGSAGPGQRLAAARGSLQVAALDALSGLREVRAFGAEGRMLAAVQAREASMMTAGRLLARRGALAGAVAFLCGQAAILLVLAIGANGRPVLTVALLFVTLAAFEAASGLPRAGALAGLASAAASRVLDAASGPAPAPAASVAFPAGSAVRFENVGFGWRPDRPSVFDGLSLDIPHGARVALIGPSGAGKSSLAALLLKVAAPQQGRVLLGGVDIATLPDAAVRARVAWLSQDTHLFDDTIRANLALAAPDANDAMLWAALAAARLDEFVRTLPDQLDTWTGEGGTRLSGGQARRLVLARTLLSPAPILLLDEPCAGLDAETEREFFASLNEGATGRTVILIVHRLTGAERIDRVWRLFGGRAMSAAA